jgi:hypothetical protein
MRLLDLYLRWHARRRFAQWQPLPAEALERGETAVPKDNVYPLW